jgi:subtilisin family serine protease
MRAFPKGTAIQRDANGDIQAVIDVHPIIHRPRGKAASVTPAQVVRALSALPGVHSAALVWGHRYQVATTLPLAALQKVPGVETVLPNNLFVSQDATSTTQQLPEAPSGTAMPVTGDPYSPDEYYLDNVGQTLAGGAEYATAGDGPNFALAWHRSTGAGATIAIIDTGVDTTNPDLAGVVLATSRNFMVSPPATSVIQLGGGRPKGRGAGNCCGRQLRQR